MFPRNENRNEGTFAKTTLLETTLLSPNDPKGWFPKGWFRRMFPRNENRNEGTFAKTTLSRNRPFISFCTLLRSFADLASVCALLRSFALICTLLRTFACFCVRPRLERPRLGTAAVLVSAVRDFDLYTFLKQLPFLILFRSGKLVPSCCQHKTANILREWSCHWRVSFSSAETAKVGKNLKDPQLDVQEMNGVQ